MTVPATAPRTDAIGTGTTATYSYGFKIFAATDLRVTVQDTVGVITRLVYLTDYTLTGVGAAAGGTITLLAGNLTSGYLLSMRFDRTPIQSTDLRNQGGFFAETHEAKFDELTRYVQQLTDLVARSLRLPETEAGSEVATILPPESLRAGTVLGFDDDGNVTTIASEIEGAAVSGFGATLIDDASAAVARTTLGVPAASSGAMTNAVFTTSTAAADPLVALGLATKQYVDNLAPGTFASYSANGAIGAGVGVASLSSASFTLTLPAAASNTNRVITFIHAGTSLTQLYTIDPNGAETIDGTATFILYTAGERLTVISDGTNWIKVNHYARTEWVDAGAMTITGSGGNPTKPTTPDLDKVYWRREGNQMFLRYALQISSAAGSAAGTGGYLFALPTNLAFDTTVVSPVGSSMISSIMSEAVRSSLSGRGTTAIDSSAIIPYQLYAVSTTTFQFVRNNAIGTLGSSLHALTNAEMSYYAEFSARAANWR